MQHHPRKRFSQNFLQSALFIEHIIKAFNPAASDTVIEIGPGQGALTQPLLTKLDALTAIEIDNDLSAYLQTLPQASRKLRLINEDALCVDFSQFGQNARVIGNLPYHISTPLLFHLLQFANTLQDMHFMLQKEVVDRLAATPGSKAYGRLAIMIQYHCEVTPLFQVPAHAFFPKPKVESAVVRLTPHKHSPYPAVHPETLKRLVAQAFSMRRKTLANTLKPWLNEADFKTLNIDPRQRPECLAILDYINIAKFVDN